MEQYIVQTNVNNYSAKIFQAKSWEHIEKWILAEGERSRKLPFYCILLYTKTSLYVKMEKATKDSYESELKANQLKGKSSKPHCEFKIFKQTCRLSSVHFIVFHSINYLYVDKINLQPRWCVKYVDHITIHNT